jgi:predicted NBD/HSP70 family sugar kinase
LHHPPHGQGVFRGSFSGRAYKGRRSIKNAWQRQSNEISIGLRTISRSDSGKIIFVATTIPGLGARGAPGIPPALPSDRDFIRALRDHAMSSGGSFASRVVGLTHPPELEQWSGLSRPSVNTLVDRFQAVLDHQDVDGKPIPPTQARRWALNSRAGLVIAVELGQVNRVAISDLYGRLAPRDDRDELDLDSLLDDETKNGAAVADKVLDWAVNSIRRLVGDRHHDDVVGVGISLAAPLDRDKGVLRAPLSARRFDTAGASTDEWQLMKAREQLVSRLGWDDVTFLLDNDANLSALAEYVWGAGRWAASRPLLPDRPPFEDMFYVEWSRGIGGGLILGGELYRGRGVSGEIGHTIIALDKNDDPVCLGCGKSGCLQSLAGWDAVFKDALNEDPDRISHNELVEMLQPEHERHEEVAKAFDRAAKRLAQVLGPVIHFLNPQLVVIGGDVGRLAYPLVRASLHQALNEYTMHPALADVTVRQTTMDEDGTLRGAIALLLLQQKDDPEALLTFLQRRAKPK